MRNRLNKASGRNDAWFAAASIAAIAGLGLCSEAKAQDVSANVALTSDYVFRGVSQTQEDPAILAGYALDFSVIGYLYAGQPDGADYDYVELKAAASRAVGQTPFGLATLGTAVYYSPDFFGASEDEATYAEINGAVSPADKWTVSGAVGRQWVSSDLDYTTWNLGAAYQLTDTLAVDLRYHDTDQHDFGDIYGARAVATLKASF